MIDLRNIYKSYGKIEALKGVDLKVERGELYGLIGPDGAGKSTLFRIMTSLLLPDIGDGWVNGRDMIKDYKALRSEIGYMPGRFSLYMDLTVEENMNFYATLFGTTLKENYHLVEDIYSQIEPFKKRRAGALSGGMKQKLALSCALIHKPVVLFLDEPTTGVDPVSRQEFWQMLKKLQKDGITTVVSTPYMDEANLCDRISLMDEGKFLMTDTPKRIAESFPRKLFKAKSLKKYQLLTELRKCEDIDVCYVFGEFHHFILKQDFENKFDIDSFAVKIRQAGIEDIEITPVTPTIEDAFMYGT